MIGKDWIDHFEKQSTPHLKKVHVGLLAALSDPMIRKVYGQEEGLNTIEYFVERIIEKRTKKK